MQINNFFNVLANVFYRLIQHFSRELQGLIHGFLNGLFSVLAKGKAFNTFKIGSDKGNHHSSHLCIGVAFGWSCIASCCDGIGAFHSITNPFGHRQSDLLTHHSMCFDQIVRYSQYILLGLCFVSDYSPIKIDRSPWCDDSNAATRPPVQLSATAMEDCFSISKSPICASIGRSDSKPVIISPING